MVHISCITCPRDLPDMYTHALGPNGPRAWVYISGKSLGYMIQLLHVPMSCSKILQPVVSCGVVVLHCMYPELY